MLCGVIGMLAQPALYYYDRLGTARDGLDPISDRISSLITTDLLQYQIYNLLCIVRIVKKKKSLSLFKIYSFSKNASPTSRAVYTAFIAWTIPMSSEFTTPSPSKHYVQRVDAGFETFKYTFCRLFIDCTKDLGTLPPKKNRDFSGIFPKGGGAFSIPKTFVYLPSDFWCVKIIVWCQTCFTTAGR